MSTSYLAISGELIDDDFMEAAITEAKQGLQEGGIPIGSVLVKERRDSWQRT